MAIYKATYCSPLLNSLDIRTACDKSNTIPCEWFTCKIDSSNKVATGYKIRILDNLNNQIFPSSSLNGGDGYISPVSELPDDPTNEYVNSGFNGTVLKIPFFQNYNYSNGDSNKMALVSYNAVYYVPSYRVDYSLDSVVGTVSADAQGNIVITGWDGKFGGEEVRLGCTVLSKNAVSGIERGIFELTDISGTTATLARCNDIDETPINNNKLKSHSVVITKGGLHDTVYSFNSSGTPSVLNNHSGLWVDIAGNHIAFDIDGSSYKWEVTLFQGDVAFQTRTVTLNPGGSTVTVKYNDYSNLDFGWFDSVLNSGKILGSTNKRIQIASSDANDAVVPTGSINSPIVLQGRYAQLLDVNSNQIASRAYVQNYDATYGHVYPISDGFSQENIDAASKICFYKHSNNVEDILTAERVTCATTIDTGPLHDGNLDIYVSSGSTFIPNVNLGLPEIDGYQTQEGDIVLVKDQTKSFENGVYIAHKTGTAWTRSGSYKTWGDFIGAVLFVMKGTENSGTNWESLAEAGGSLYDATTGSGQSSLLFTEERPVNLFPVGDIQKTVNLLTYKKPYDLVDVSKGDSYYESSLTSPHTWFVWLRIRDQSTGVYNFSRIKADGVGYQNGQRVLCYYDGKIFAVDGVYYSATSGGGRVSLDSAYFACIIYREVDTATTSDHILISDGKSWGGYVAHLYGTAPGPFVTIRDYSTEQAQVLKNSTTYTYISPYVGLKKDMAFKVLNNQKVTYSDSSVSEWIKINSVNTTLWRITHKTLAAALPSNSMTDATIPYSYEVRTFYRASDENPFSSYEQPYLTIMDEEGLAENEELDTRTLTLWGKYHQFQEMSWESYRWVLTDYYGEILQDTGLKYDRDMKVTFFGLSNENYKNKNHYRAALYVVDSVGNELSTGIAFYINPTSGVRSDIDFSARLDCSTHSMILTYQDNVVASPSIFYNNLVWRYNAENGINWDNSYLINDDEQLVIKDVANTYEVPLPNIYEPLQSDGQRSGLSYSVLHGVEYSHYFLHGQESTLGSTQELSVEGDEAYLETELILDDNTCGDFLTFTIEGPNNQDFWIKLGTPKNYDSTGMNANRNCFTLSIKKVSSMGSPIESYLYKNSSEYLTWYTLNRNNKFVLQKATKTASAENEYHFFETRPSDLGGGKLWYKLGSSSLGQRYLNSEYPLGNNGLVEESVYSAIGHTGPMYWAENRGVLIYKTAAELNGLLEDGTIGINLTTSDYDSANGAVVTDSIPTWPSNDDDYVWVEDDIPSGAPASWDGISDAGLGSGLTLWKPMARHPNSLSNQVWRVVIRVYSIDELFNHLDSLVISGDDNYENLTHLGEYATIEFAKINN